MEQLTYINNLKKQIIEDITTNYKNFELKKKFSLSFLKDKFNSSTLDPLILEVLCFVLKINMLVFNFEDNKIYCLNKGHFFNPWIPSIILAKYKDYWEPISNENSKVFNLNDNCIKKILNEDLLYYSSDYLANDFTLVDNISEILQNIKKKTKILNHNETNSAFTTTHSLSKKLTPSKLKKMRKEQIIKLVNDMNLKVTVLKPTKDYLIKLIMNNK